MPAEPALPATVDVHETLGGRLPFSRDTQAGNQHTWHNTSPNALARSHRDAGSVPRPRGLSCQQATLRFFFFTTQNKVPRTLACIPPISTNINVHLWVPDNPSGGVARTERSGGSSETPQTMTAQHPPGHSPEAPHTPCSTRARTDTRTHTHAYTCAFRGPRPLLCRPPRSVVQPCTPQPR